MATGKRSASDTSQTASTEKATNGKLLEQLPRDFLRERKNLLGDEWECFLQSYGALRTYGLRLNPLKSSAWSKQSSQDIATLNSFMKGTGVIRQNLTPVPWAKNGFYYTKDDQPGKHPLHEAGAYYIQEPSAMSVVTLLDPQPGESICDLCAAPGGKSTQIAGMMQGQGILVTNEIISSRARILSQNIERMGIPNALVCNEAPDQMAEHFPLFFHRILVDAPCSGEGMFRKDETAIREWSLENVESCAKRQQMILTAADRMLRPGGILVYSTCTFSPKENEENILWFLQEHPDYILLDWHDTALGRLVQDKTDDAGLTDGSTTSFQLPGTLRLWPHKVAGEGHFAAILKKNRTESQPLSPKKKSSKQKKKKASSQQSSAYLSESIQAFSDFSKKYLQDFKIDKTETHRLELFGNELYLLPENCPVLNGIHLLRTGLHLGTLKKNRLDPAHALSRFLLPAQTRGILDCNLDMARIYLKGETLACPDSLHGWVLVCYEEFPLGWGKAKNGVLKNHFPKGLRQL